jgi:YjbE family integral membrane protein
VFWGALGAIVLRIVLTFFAVALLEVPYLKLIGAVLLLWIGVKLIIEEDEEGHEIKASERLLGAVRTVIIADLVMSIDNVVAVAAAAKGSLVLLIFGLVVSIPLVILGAQLILKLIQRLPLLVVAGGGLLGFIAGELLATDSGFIAWVGELHGWEHWAIPVAGVILVVGIGKWIERRRPRVGPTDVTR